MKTLKYIFLLAAFATIGLTSCTKEDKVVDETEDPTEVTPETGISNGLIDNISSRSDGSLDLGCFTIDYPFSLFVDGEEVEIDDEDDFISTIENLDEESLVDFLYPLAITYEDGTTASIADGEELGVAFVSCLPDDGWSIDSTWNGESLFPAFLIATGEYCVDLVYPVGLVDIDGNTSSAANEDEFIDLLANAQDILFFEFPLTVIDEEGVQSTLENGDVLFELLLACDEGNQGGGFDTTITYGGEIGCYGVEFPFSVVMADGSTVEVNNHDEFCILMLEGNFVSFAFPLTLIDFAGELIVVNSEEELQNALADCWGGGPVIDPGFYLLMEGSSDAGFDCYDVNYPINVVINEEVTVLNNFEEAIAAAGSQNDFVQLEYPVSVTMVESGDVVSIADFEGLAEILSDCE